MNSQAPSHTFGHLAPTSGAPAGAMRRAILGALRRLRAWRCRRLAIRELERLDAHLLADIGLDRGRIRYAVEGLTGTPARRVREPGLANTRCLDCSVVA